MSDVAVIGAGAWGVALAIQAARAGASVTLWARNPDRAAELAASRTSRRLPGARVPDAVRVTHDMPRAALTALAVPMQHLRETARLCEGAALVACSKGVEAATLRLPLEVLAELHPGAALCMLTGPNLAHEVAAGLPAACVAASADRALRADAAAAFGSARFRIYGSRDPVGAQVGAAAKNVVAIAAGIVTGAGLGENARAGLVTRGLAEIARLAEALGGRRETVMGLSGLGDLALTCASPASRNFSLGVALGRGEALADILSRRSGVTEGVATAPALVARAGPVDVPVCRATADLLAGRITLARAVEDTLARPAGEE